MAKNPKSGKGKGKAAEPEVEETPEVIEDEDFEEDDLDDLDEESEDDAEEDDDLEEIEDDEEPAPKAKKNKAKSTKAKAPAREKIEFGSSWLAQHATETTGVTVDARSLRILLRKMAKNEEIGAGRDDKSRYSWTGPKDPEVKLIVKAIKGGALEKTKSDGLEAARAAKAAKKAAAEAEAAAEAAKADKAKKKKAPAKKK